MNDYQKFKAEQIKKVSDFFAAIDLKEFNTKLSKMSPAEFQDWYYRDFTYAIPHPDWGSAEGSGQRADDFRAILREIRGTTITMTEQFVNSSQILQSKLKYDVEYRKEQALIRQQEARERFMTVTIDGVQYKAKKAIDVLWSGWECDATAWLVEVDGMNKLVVTNHGQQHFADKEWLEGKISEYNEALEESKNLLKELE